MAHPLWIFSSSCTHRSARIDLGNELATRVQRALSLLDAGVEDGMNVGSLATRIGVSRRGLLRLFQRETEHTPMQLPNERRLERARSLILHSHLPLAVVANAVGFSSQSHMTRRYRQRYAITPAKDRQQTSQRQSLIKED